MTVKTNKKRILASPSPKRFASPQRFAKASQQSMTEKAMSDNAIMKMMGTFIKHHRLEQNKTQGQLAEEAGINRSTLVEFEQGKRSTILTLIQLLRTLNLLHVLESLELQQQMSPIQLAKLDQAKRKRASKLTLRRTKGKRRKSNW